MMKSEPLQIENVPFLISNIMQDCPARTVIRELLQNAIEASGPQRIEWFCEEFNSVPKLGIYNEGVGMTGRELGVRMNIASSGKKLGRHDNFGQGAKMSAAKASPHGIIYRSCKDGIVSEIWLQVQQETSTLVKVPQFDIYDEEMVLVRQVTDDAASRGRSLDIEWTEAILLGRSTIDDTTTGDFLGYASSLWLMQAINQRYYRFPDGVNVRNVTVTSDRADHNRKSAKGLAAALDGAATERSEIVVAKDFCLGEIGIVYGKLAGTPKSRRSGHLAEQGIPGGTHVCIVYKDEIYNFDPRWCMRSGAYGFSGASDDYYVHLIIADTARVRNNNHRTEVVTDDTRSEVQTCESLCNLVRDNRPQWVIDDINSRLESQTSGRLQDRIRGLAERFNAKADLPVVKPGEEMFPGVVELDRGDGGRGGNSGRDRTPRENGRTVRRDKGKPQNRPRPDTLKVSFRAKHEATWYKEMAGRAGAYEEFCNTLWLSYEFVEYERLRQMVHQKWPGGDDNVLALTTLDEEYAMHAASLGIGALSFRGSDTWSPDQWLKGMTTEAISAHMRDASGVIEIAVNRAVGRRLGTQTRARSSISQEVACG